MNYLDLYDYRRRVLALYRDRNEALQDGKQPETVLQRFREERDRLFAHHPQSALNEEQKRQFQGLSYFPHNLQACVEATVELRAESERGLAQTSGDETMPLRRSAILHFTINGEAAELSMYWIDVYGGGLFLPFRDATAPVETYGGGRYLFDTIKGSDFLVLSSDNGCQRIQLDFNYAYNPSCAYNHRWTCPLAPPENRLHMPIPAGEKNFSYPGPK